MFKNVYTNPLAKSEETKAKAMLKMLFEYYMRNIELMPEEFIYLIEEKGQDEERVVCDYIAGMSDQYSVAKFQQIYEPGFWKMWLDFVLSTTKNHLHFPCHHTSRCITVLDVEKGEMSYLFL